MTNAPGDPVSKAQAVGEAYHRFAMKNPHAYRIMFDIDAPIDDSHPELGPQGAACGDLHHEHGRTAGQGGR